MYVERSCSVETAGITAIYFVSAMLDKVAN